MLGGTRPDTLLFRHGEDEDVVTKNGSGMLTSDLSEVEQTLLAIRDNKITVEQLKNFNSEDYPVFIVKAEAQRVVVRAFVDSSAPATVPAACEDLNDEARPRPSARLSEAGGANTAPSAGAQPQQSELPSGMTTETGQTSEQQPSDVAGQAKRKQRTPKPPVALTEDEATRAEAVRAYASMIRRWFDDALMKGFKMYVVWVQGCPLRVKDVWPEQQKGRGNSRAKPPRTLSPDQLESGKALYIGFTAVSGYVAHEQLKKGSTFPYGQFRQYKAVCESLGGDKCKAAKLWSYPGLAVHALPTAVSAIPSQLYDTRANATAAQSIAWYAAEEEAANAAYPKVKPVMDVLADLKQLQDRKRYPWFRYVDSEAVESEARQKLGDRLKDSPEAELALRHVLLGLSAHQAKQVQLLETWKEGKRRGDEAKAAAAPAAKKAKKGVTEESLDITPGMVSSRSYIAQLLGVTMSKVLVSKATTVLDPTPQRQLTIKEAMMKAD
ncbi:hypothetical protein HYH03_000744 [Edaphochlamys debaryana]|uniref:Uncharacterized protein n=1 Tax=Edaphochlamys debaryana TaxID=47281 RepID=A0A835YFS3_9CHLO|nr:hypothetical protein HYH03_000744 [Edaphochlamys debaryana]|eukprot:KAG2500917.1 hypothetical protein HYH03_000744 [Edaphochlamys debaryana]